MIGDSTRYDTASAAASNQPEGSVMTVEFELEGQAFVVNCSRTDEVDQLWVELSKGGEELMPIDSYLFSDW